MNRLVSIITMAAACLLPSGIASAESGEISLSESSSFLDHFEVGGFLGWHFFDADNELGVVDKSGASGPADFLVFGVRLSYALTDRLSAEGEFGLIPTEVEDSSVAVLVAAPRIQALFHFGDADSKLRPFALAGVGAQISSSDDESVLYNDTDAMFHFGVGVKFKFAENWGVRGDLRAYLPPSSESDFATLDFEALLGVFRTFGGKEEAPPLPPPPGDTDGDGITDDVDDCPQDPEDQDGFEDDNGCPDPDNDGDGIADPADTCPMEAEDIDGFEDEDGCPDGDNDADGFADGEDKCPLEAEDKDGFQDEDGCPDPDNDNDGVLDANDKCPTELENMNGYEDDDGCPDEIPVAVKKFTGAIKGITFKTNSAEIRSSSFKTLNAAAKVLTEFSALRMEIQGHTDSQGDHDYNVKLSQDRAQSVMDYLVAQGIAAARLSAKGYGPDVPVADNKRRSGRAKNRRVEFQLVQGAGPAAPAPLAPEAGPAPEAAPVPEAGPAPEGAPAPEAAPAPAETPAGGGD